MLTYATRLIAGLIGTTVMIIFIVGLSISISSGFAGFWGGLPFAIIATIVLCMALYDFYDECVRRR